MLETQLNGFNTNVSLCCNFICLRDFLHWLRHIHHLVGVRKKTKHYGLL